MEIGHSGARTSAATRSVEKPDTPATPARRARDLVLAYVALTKPRVIELLLVATVPVMLLADRGSVDIALIAVTLVGGWLGAASANTLNMVVDADIDQKMKRTARRPLARHAVGRGHAFVFGVGPRRGVVRGALGVREPAERAVGDGDHRLLRPRLHVDPQAADLTERGLGRRRRLHAHPGRLGRGDRQHLLAADRAVPDHLLLDTAAHLALAMRYKEDYAAAGVPMLPVVATEQQVARQMVIYTWATVAATLCSSPRPGGSTP